MKKIVKKLAAMLVAAVLCVALTACGGGLSDEQQAVVDAVRTTVQSEAFAEWQALYQQFSGSAPRGAEISRVLHYEIADFEGEPADCWLVQVSADVGWWSNEEAQEGAMSNGFQMVVDGRTGMVLDSISSDAGNFDGDVSTPEGRLLYLLWVFGNMQNGSYEGSFLNDTETVTELSTDEVAAMSEALAE